MEQYIAKRNCYYNGLYLKKGEVITVPKGTKVTFALLEKYVKPAPSEEDGTTSK